MSCPLQCAFACITGYSCCETSRDQDQDQDQGWRVGNMIELIEMGVVRRDERTIARKSKAKQINLGTRIHRPTRCYDYGS